MNALTIHTAYEQLGKAAPVAVKTQRIRVTHKTFRDTHVSDIGGGETHRHLDWANDAWLRSDGSILTRNWGVIGSVAHLRGAAQVSAALKMLFDFRGA